MRSSSPNPTLGGGSASSPTPDSGGPPASSGCEAVDGGAAATVIVAAGGNQGCSFTAVNQGGYSGIGTWYMSITRQGVTTDYESSSTPSCRNTGFIQPGDQVTIGVPVGQNGDIKAGEAAHC